MNKLLLAASAAAALAFSLPAYGQSAPSTETSATLRPATANEAQLNSVARAQLKLKDAGLYHGSVNGVRNLATARAIRQFQRQHNLQITGTLTPETRAALEI